MRVNHSSSTKLASSELRLWHFVQEGLAQYEVICSKIPEIKLFFHDFHLDFTKNRFLTIEEYCKTKNKNYSYIKDLAKIYSSDQNIYMTNKNTILIKEAYSALVRKNSNFSFNALIVSLYSSLYIFVFSSFFFSYFSI